MVDMEYVKKLELKKKGIAKLTLKTKAAQRISLFSPKKAKFFKLDTTLLLLGKIGLILLLFSMFSSRLTTKNITKNILQNNLKFSSSFKTMILQV